MTTIATHRVYASELHLRQVLDIADETEERTYDFYGYSMQLPETRKFWTLESVAAYYQRVCSLAQVQRNWPGIEAPAVRPRKGGSVAHYEQLTQTVAIYIANRAAAIPELLVLHELAHHLEHDGHGPLFRGAFIFLVQEAIGPELAMILAAGYVEETGENHRVYN